MPWCSRRQHRVGQLLRIRMKISRPIGVVADESDRCFERSTPCFIGDNLVHHDAHLLDIRRGKPSDGEIR